MLKKYLSNLVALLLLMSFVQASTLAVEDTGYDKKMVSKKDLTPVEVDQAFDQIFSTQKRIERMQAKVITEKSGGIFKKSKGTEAMVYAQMPDKLLFVDKGRIGDNTKEDEYAIILIDGIFLWDVKSADGSGMREAEQIDMKQAGSKDINIAALLIGADVATGRELRDYYDIAGRLEEFVDGSRSYHFLLKAISGKGKERDEVVDMWIEVGGVIPWKIKTQKQVKKVNPLNPNAPAKTKKTASTKYILDLQTNISKPPLPAFAKDQFFFGRIMEQNPRLKVLDGKGEAIPPEVLKKELAGVARSLQQ